jgi:hypothetical protein
MGRFVQNRLSTFWRVSPFSARSEEGCSTPSYNTFLQDEGTQNGRLRKRAGRLDVLDVAERAG